MKGFGKAVIGYTKELADCLTEVSSYLSKQEEKLEEFFRIVSESNAIHIYGVGRSGAAALSLALRLKHFEKHLKNKVWWVGDEVRERIRERDILIAFSGSGETAEVLVIAERAKAVGAKVVAITSFEDSTLASLADLVLLLPGGLEKKRGWGYVEAQLSELQSPFYGGGEFELIAYLFQEALLTAIGEFKNIPKAVIAEEHEEDEMKKWNQK
ncbi:SIS domain-containing protein [Methanophagales archaeon]|nr:MAG: SIS domain-containing protein [Methanophagales archaeon]